MSSIAGGDECGLNARREEICTGLADRARQCPRGWRIRKASKRRRLETDRVAGGERGVRTLAARHLRVDRRSVRGDRAAEHIGARREDPGGEHENGRESEKARSKSA